MVLMLRHSCVAVVRLQDRVMTHPGTNGYVSTWGEELSGCQPTVDIA